MNLTPERLELLKVAARAVVGVEPLEGDGSTYTEAYRNACKEFAHCLHGDWRVWNPTHDRTTAKVIHQLITELDAARSVINAYHAYDQYVGETPCPDCAGTGSRNVEEAGDISNAIFHANNAYATARADTNGGCGMPYGVFGNENSDE